MIKVLIFLLATIPYGISQLSAAPHKLGYFYPIPKNIENYKSKARISSKTSRLVRLKTVDNLRKNFRDEFFRSRFLILVEDNSADNIIFMGLSSGIFDTFYRSRALLESMNSVIRSSIVVNNLKIDNNYNTLDLLKILGFRKITFSDGDQYTYQVFVK